MPKDSLQTTNSLFSTQLSQEKEEEEDISGFILMLRSIKGIMSSKKAKLNDVEPSSKSDLQSLLTQLNGGKTLDLSVIAAIQEARNNASKYNNSFDTNNPYDDNLNSVINKLFTDHVGISPKVVVDNAIRHAKDQADLEGSIFNEGQRSGMRMGDERHKVYNHPQNRVIGGPKPDCSVWIHLFLGSEKAEEVLEGSVPLDESYDIENDTHSDKILESEICRALSGKARYMSTIDLLENILRYVREEANKTSLKDLLRFSVLYGLDGVMKDILEGRYGKKKKKKKSGININTLLPLDDEPLPDGSSRPDRWDLWGKRKLFYPAWAMGAILGYTNVVVASLTKLDGKMDVPTGVQFKQDEEMKTYDNHKLPSDVFTWVCIQKNMPDMIKCLVNDCGFQFRWIDHRDHIPMIIQRLFDESEYESHPKWMGDYDEEDLFYAGGSRGRCRLRASAAYKVQMAMLDVLISCGLPYSVLFSTDPGIEREEELRKEKKLETRAECKAYMRNMDTDQRKAREVMYQACSAYNSIQESEPETLTMGDFYQKLKSRWEGQESVQTDRLPDFEELDSRWREERMPKEERHDEDSESYYDSDDGSSYGSGPFG